MNVLSMLMLCMFCGFFAYAACRMRKNIQERMHTGDWLNYYYWCPGCEYIVDKVNYDSVCSHCSTPGSKGKTVTAQSILQNGKCTAYNIVTEFDDNGQAAECVRVFRGKRQNIELVVKKHEKKIVRTGLMFK